MTHISNNCIVTINSSDTFTCPLFINKGNLKKMRRYKIKSSDVLYFAIAEPNQPFEHAAVRQIYTIKNVNEYGDVVIKLNPSDTEFLVPGTYYMEAKIRLRNGSVYTVLPKRKFYINE